MQLELCWRNFITQKHEMLKKKSQLKKCRRKDIEKIIAKLKKHKKETHIRKIQQNTDSWKRLIWFLKMIKKNQNDRSV